MAHVPEEAGSAGSVGSAFTSEGTVRRSSAATSTEERKSSHIAAGGSVPPLCYRGVTASRRALCVDTGVMLVLAASDTLRYLRLDGAAGCGEPHGGEVLAKQALFLAVLYAVLFAALGAVTVRCCTRVAPCNLSRPLWLLLATLHTAVALVPSHAQASSTADGDDARATVATASFLQLLVAVLYPADLCSHMLVSAAALAGFAACESARTVGPLREAEFLGSLLVLAAAGIASTAVRMDWHLEITRARCSLVTTFDECPSSPRGSWKCTRVADTQAKSLEALSVFRPVFGGEVHPSAVSKDREVSTRLDRIVSRLGATKDNIAHSQFLDNELRTVLHDAFGALLKELKDVSSLHLMPMVGLAGASPMTVEFVEKTLAQASTDAEEGETLAQSNSDDVRRSSLQRFVKEQTVSLALHSRMSTTRRDTQARAGKLLAIGGDRPQASRIPGSPDSAQEGNSDSDDPATESGNKSEHKPPLPACVLEGLASTFDEAIQAMMTSLTFCEYWDELPPPSIVTELEAMLSRELGTWCFDVFRLSRLCESRPLVVAGSAALQPHADDLGIQASKVRAFLDAVEARYHSLNPYHNSMHAADVVNSVLYFLDLGNTPISSVEPVERFATLVAAGAHDVGHNGKSNRYHVAAMSPLAMLYNDQSVLENMHCALTFAVLHASSSNFMSDLEGPQQATFRGLVVQEILDTDLGKHIQTVSRFRQEFLNNGEPQAAVARPALAPTPHQRKEMLTFTMKCADVAGSVKPFELHAQWAMRINTEFFEQGDAERELALPISPFCDRCCTDVCESQRGFFDFIVAPLYTAIDEYLASSRVRFEVLPERERNHGFWKQYDGFGFDFLQPMASYEALRRAFSAEPCIQPPSSLAPPGASIHDSRSAQSSSPVGLTCTGGPDVAWTRKSHPPQPVAAPGGGPTEVVAPQHAGHPRLLGGRRSVDGTPETKALVTDGSTPSPSLT